MYTTFDPDFILETDASILGLGVVLSQEQDDHPIHPVVYASHALSPYEKNYGSTDLETLAVVWALTHFKVYLYGQWLKVITDYIEVSLTKSHLLVASMLDGGPKCLKVALPMWIMFTAEGVRILMWMPCLELHVVTSLAFKTTLA